MENFHNQCTSDPMSTELYKQLRESTPDFIKVFCPTCMSSVGHNKQRIEDIAEELAEVKATLNTMNQNRSKPDNSPSWASTVAAQKKVESTVNNTNRLLQNMARKKEPESSEERANKQARTLMVKQYKDKTVVSSRDIRKKVNEAFQGVVIRNARTTAGGSIILELDDQTSANTVANNWTNTLFGGNNGIMRGNKPKNAGVIKHVYVDRTEEEIENAITSKYPGSELEFFKRNDRFTGTIKVKFSQEGDLENAMQNRIEIFEQMCIVEKFVFKPRVIMCRNCIKYGHVQRLCRQDNPVCGKCKSQEHATENCVVEERYFKCFHCDGNHQAGSKSCLIHQAKEEELRSRFQDD